jgi:hypothetical protein
MRGIRFLSQALILLTAAAVMRAHATNRFMIDGIHGLSEVSTAWLSTDLDSLYPDVTWVFFDSDRLPIYSLIAAGQFTQPGRYNIGIEVPAGAHSLYAVLGSEPVPDQSETPGAYQMCHVDDPMPGHWVLSTDIVAHPATYPYRVGTGPYLWEVYPPEDYDGVFDLHCLIWYMFTGEPTPRSAADSTRMRQMLDAGGSVGLFYDGAEPMADKPIIHLLGMAREGASVRLDIPGRVTYAVPQPKDLKPLVWDVAPTSGDVELDYEARFDRSLNFVSRSGGSVTNESWATVRDLKVIEFVRGQGYRISEAATLLPGESASSGAAVPLPYFEARNLLDRAMRREAVESGLDEPEAQLFCNKYRWAEQVLSRCCSEPGLMAFYRIDGEDYDALFPLQVSPRPSEMRRVLWVASYLPDRVRERSAVHPRLGSAQGDPPGRQMGRYHEYGYFRETYGGDALDEMDQWSWHFYDQPLADSTNYAEYPTMILFHQWGASPLVARLLQGVAQIEGQLTGGILPAAGNSEVVVSGDDDTNCDWVPDCPFPIGSYPPVVVARQEPLGGRIAGFSDFSFLGNLANNTNLIWNVVDWMNDGPTGEGPDIDIPIAVVEQALPEGGSNTTTLEVRNLGDVPLSVVSDPPEVSWLSVSGPSDTTIGGGDHIEYTLNWSAASVPAGWYQAMWQFLTNDPNESNLSWPVRLRVGNTGAVPPQAAHGTVDAFELQPPFPNPFNAVITLSFTLSREQRVRADLYNTLGEKVAAITDRVMPVGTHSMALDLSKHPAGVYFLRAQAGQTMRVHKLLLIK